MTTVVKVSGTPAAQDAKNLLDASLDKFESLFATNEHVTLISSQDGDISSTRSLRGFFVMSLLIGSILVPALDALSLKLKSTVPSFKKKKGALAQELD